MENNEEVVKLLKKQVFATRIRNIVLIVLVALVAYFVFYMKVSVDQAMMTVQHIDELTEEIQSEIQAIDIDSLNSTISSMDTITKDLEVSVQNFEDVSNSIKNLFRL